MAWNEPGNNSDKNGGRKDGPKSNDPWIDNSE